MLSHMVSLLMMMVSVMVNMISGPLSLARDDQLMVFRLAQAWPTLTIPATDSGAGADQSQRPRLFARLLLAERARPARRGQPTGQEKFVMREPH